MTHRRPTSRAGCRSARRQVSSELLPQQLPLRGFGHRLITFDTSAVVPLRSSSCPSPDPVTSEPFPSAFTTVAFARSRRRWFGTCSCKPVPRGLPSSVKQLRTSSAFRPFAVLVAHCCRYLGEVQRSGDYAKSLVRDTDFCVPRAQQTAERLRRCATV